MNGRGLWCAAALPAVFVACGGTPKFIPPERTVYLAIPIESNENSPLTYVVKANSDIDYSAPFVTGTSVTQKAKGVISEVVSASDALRVSGGLEQVRIAAGADKITHVIIDADVDGVFVIRDIKYNSKSKCCEDGEPTASCEGGYIESVMVGTGTVTYAKLKDSGAEAPEGPIGRSRLDPVKKRPFENSYFAFTVVSAQRACEFSQ